MNIKQVRYFVSAYESRSFSATAKASSVTVQAISKSIGDLEGELGCRLFEREGRSIHPTAAGDAFYVIASRAAVALDDLEGFPAHLARIREDETLTVAICTPQFTGSDVICRFLSHAAQVYLGIQTRFELLEPELGIEGLRRGEISVLLCVGSFEGDEYETLTLGTLPTGVAFAKGHPLSGKKTVTLAELVPYPAGMSRRYDSTPASIMRLYLRHGLVENYRRVATPEEASELLYDLNGYFFRAILPIRGTKGDLVEVSIDPAEALQVPICLVNLAGCASPGVKSFKQLVSKLPFLGRRAAQEASE